MPTIAYYNPGYELSVERGTTHFTPSKLVGQLRRDLATLPFYYTDSDDLILLPSPLPPALSHDRFVTALPRGGTLQPWGWAPELLSLIPVASFPYTLRVMRQLTSRALTLELWQCLRQVAPTWLQPYSTPIAITSLSEVTPLLLSAHQSGGVVLKDEFSSSGRGVEFVPPTRNLGERIEQRLGKKGRRGAKSLFLEPWHQGAVRDVGYEFEINEMGEVVYLGVSFFRTAKGQYLGNHLGPAVELEQEAKCLPMHPTHDATIQHLTQALTLMPTLRQYRGRLGVDLLLATLPNSNDLQLTPPLEINCRTTMGHLALALGDQWLSPQQRARFQIHYDSHLATLLSPQLHSSEPLYLHPAEPLHTSGLYLLTPLLPDSQFAATLELL